MDHVGIDVHTRERQICIRADGGELIERRIRTEAERFAAVLGDRPRVRIVIEASTDTAPGTADARAHTASGRREKLMLDGVAVVVSLRATRGTP